jgi:microcystin-dependent protein
MPLPEKPDLDYSYSAFQQSQGNNSFPGTFLDNDLANLKASIDETIDFVSPIIRPDGELQNAIVKKANLAADLLLGVAPPRPWTAGVNYVVDQTATINNSIYICIVAHLSGTFATDLAVGRWGLIAELTVPAAISDGTVTEPKHATGGVSARALAVNSVPTSKVVNGAITAIKLDPTVAGALVPVGAEMDYAGWTPPAGWLFEFGQTVSRATYPALFSALVPVVLGDITAASSTITGIPVDLRNLGLEGAVVEGLGVVPGTTVASVTATTIVMSAAATNSTASAQVRIFPHGNGDGATTFTLPDARDRASIGRGNMGGAAAGRVTTVGPGQPGVDTSRLGRTGGVDRHTLTAAQIAAHTHPATGTAAEAGAHSHAYIGPEEAGTTAHPTGSGRVDPSNNITRGTEANGVHTHTLTISVSANTGGEAHPNLQPSRVTNKIIFTGVV